MSMTTEVMPEEISLALIDDNPFQTRLTYNDEKIGALAASIAEHGLLQIPLARRVGDRVQLAFGHSRFRAYQTIASVSREQTHMPLIIRELDDQTMALHAWTENNARSDLTAYEEAKAIQKYMETFGWSQKQVAEHLKLNPSTISNKLRLLKLPEAVLTQVLAGTVSERQAIALLPLTELPDVSLTADCFYGDGRKQLRDVYGLASTLDSGQLRTVVEQGIRFATLDIKNEAWSKMMIANVGAHAPLCGACPILIKSNGRCPDRACATRKAAGYQVQLASNAAVSLELRPVPTPEHGEYDSLGGNNLAAMRDTAIAKQCNNLVVAHRSYQIGLVIPRHKDCYAVCLHGQGKRCGCKMALANSGDPKKSEQARKRADKVRIKNEIIAPAQQQLASSLRIPTRELICMLITETGSYSANKKAKDVTTIEQAYALLAEALVEKHTAYSYTERGDYKETQQGLTRFFSQAGLMAPWDRPTEPAAPDLRANAPQIPPRAITGDSTLDRDVQAALTALGLRVRWHQGRILVTFADGSDASGIGQTFYDSAELRTWLPTAELVAGVASSENRAGILPGITILHGSMADRHEVAHLVAQIAILAVSDQVRPMQVVELVSTLEGMPDALDDDTYEALMFDLHRLQQRQKEDIA